MGLLQYTLPPGKILHPTKWKGTQTGGYSTTHPALDIPNADPIPVYAVADGEIVLSKCDNATGYGGEIVQRFELPEKGTIYARYAHLQERLVQTGDRVEMGQEIGVMGGVPGTPCAGYTTGRHLHFELSTSPNYQTGRFDPTPYIAAESALGTIVAGVSGGNPTRNLLLIFAVVFGLIYFILKR